MAYHDSQIDYWASLCEDASLAEARKRDKEDRLAEKCYEMNESTDDTYIYDTIDQAPIYTVKQLKDILQRNFKDTDKISIIGPDYEQLEVKAIWNSSMEQSVSGIEDSNGMCYIRVAE